MKEKQKAEFGSNNFHRLSLELCFLFLWKITLITYCVLTSVPTGSRTSGVEQTEDWRACIARIMAWLRAGVDMSSDGMETKTPLCSKTYEKRGRMVVWVDFEEN